MSRLFERRNLRRRGCEVGDARVHHHHACNREPAEIAQGKAGSPPRAGGFTRLPSGEGEFAALCQRDARRTHRSDGAEESARADGQQAAAVRPLELAPRVLPGGSHPSSLPDEFDAHVGDVGPPGRDSHALTASVRP